MATRANVGFATAQADAFRARYANCVIAVYSGSQPTTAALAETVNGGVLLGYITESGGTFVSGSPDNGLNFDAAVDGVVSKAAAETWVLTPVASGTPGYARCYVNTVVTGANEDADRFDMSCGVGVGQLRFAYSTVQAGVAVPVNTFTATFPTED